MTAQDWPGKLVQISASVHRLHGRGDSPFMPEGRSTDTLVVDQVQLTSEVTYRSQLPCWELPVGLCPGHRNGSM